MKMDKALKRLYAALERSTKLWTMGEPRLLRPGIGEEVRELLNEQLAEAILKLETFEVINSNSVGTVRFRVAKTK